MALAGAGAVLGAHAGESTRLRAVGTTSDLASLAAAVCGELAETRSIMLPGTSSAAFEPRASDMGVLADSAVVVRVGLGYDAWLDRLRELNERHRLGIPGWRLGFAAIARGVPSEELIPWLDALKVRRRDTQHIAAAVTLGPQIVDRLSSDSLSPAELVALAEPHAPDAPLFALALTDLPQLHEYFERLGSIRLEITGRDVAELGLGESPRVGEVLAELRRRKLNGELDGRESELAAARELIEQT